MKLVLYIDKYKKAISLIDNINLELTSNKELIENDEFSTSLNNIRYILTQKLLKSLLLGL